MPAWCLLPKGDATVGFGGPPIVASQHALPQRSLVEDGGVFKQLWRSVHSRAECQIEVLAELRLGVFEGHRLLPSSLQDWPDAFVLERRLPQLQMFKGRCLHDDRRLRSEERRVGKEGRSRWWPDHLKKKNFIKNIGVLRFEGIATSSATRRHTARE